MEMLCYVLLISVLLISIIYAYLKIMIIGQKKVRRMLYADRFIELDEMQKEVPLYQQMNIKVESICSKKVSEIDSNKFEVYSPNINSDLVSEWRGFFSDFEIPCTILINDNKSYWIFQRDILSLYPNFKNGLKRYFVSRN